MASIISAGTTSGTSLNLSGDTSGVLQLASNGSTTAVTIDTSQNVGIGTSSPTTRLSLNVAGATDLYTRFTNGSFTSGFYVGLQAGNSALLAVNDNLPMAFQTNGTERMRITTGGTGELIVGGTTATLSNASRGSIIANGSSSAIFQLNVGNANQSYVYHDNGGMSIWNTTNTIMNFATNNTERMRITSGGYTKMSNTGTYVNSTGNYHEMVGDSVSDTVVIRASSGSLNGSIVYVDANRNTTNNTFYAINYFNNGAGAYKFRVADSGNVTNTNGTYGTISDIKNKENIVDATPKLDKVNQLKVRNYNFIGDDLKQIGFVAQEFEQVFPSMVEEHPDKDAEGNDLGTTTKSIKTSVLIPIIVKAIQEQQAQIEELKAELDATKAEVQALKGVA